MDDRTHSAEPSGNASSAQEGRLARWARDAAAALLKFVALGLGGLALLALVIPMLTGLTMGGLYSDEYRLAAFSGIVWALGAVPFLWFSHSGRQAARKVLLWAGAAAGAALLVHATAIAGGPIPPPPGADDVPALMLACGLTWGVQAGAAPLLLGVDACLDAAGRLSRPAMSSSDESSGLEPA